MSASLIVWSPEESQIQSEKPLAAPIGALDWLSDGALLLADWSGSGTVHHLDASQPDQPYQLNANLDVAKDMVSEAQFSPNFRLISDWDANDLLSGAE